MKFRILALAASVALVACQSESTENTPTTDDVQNVETPNAQTVSLNISGMT